MYQGFWGFGVSTTLSGKENTSGLADIVFNEADLNQDGRLNFDEYKIM